MRYLYKVLRYIFGFGDGVKIAADVPVVGEKEEKYEVMMTVPLPDGRCLQLEVFCDDDGGGSGTLHYLECAGGPVLDGFSFGFVPGEGLLDITSRMER